jgi:putative acetyltransferase
VFTNSIAGIGVKKKPIRPGAIIKKLKSNGDDVVFRYLKPGDAEGAMKYINSLVEEKAFVGMQTKQTLANEKKWLSESLKKMRDGRGVTIVVEINGRFMGSAGVSRKPLDANSHVCTIGVGLHQDSRGRGIGTELMKTLVQQGRDVLGCKVAEISVYEPNSVAKRVYEKSGFKVTGSIPKGCHYHGKYYDEIIMVREL